MPVTLDRRPMGTYPFGVFHTSWGPTFRTESELQSFPSVGDVPSLADTILHNLIAHLFSVILSPINVIQSWNSIKNDLQLFVDFSIFSSSQIEQIHSVSIQEKFQLWFKKHFNTLQLNYIPSTSWPLQMAIAFSSLEYFDTFASKSRDWNIGLFAQFETTSDGKAISDRQTRDLIADNKRRQTLSQYAIQEVMAINQIAALLQNSWTQANAENYLKECYSNS
ncbi:unnamed protein product [Adineta steineri]|uniref:Uncharacterized protein n=1 Tax=Adineta steineri TaxID=433720 RepID=A0A816DMZ0_9BILA|nr:unnamed protein product [Adineta steineri]CAF1639250.1 unnamed protein product [Adineta steineri]